MLPYIIYDILGYLYHLFPMGVIFVSNSEVSNRERELKNKNHICIVLCFDLNGL